MRKLNEEIEDLKKDLTKLMDSHEKIKTLELELELKKKREAEEELKKKEAQPLVDQSAKVKSLQKEVDSLEFQNQELEEDISILKEKIAETLGVEALKALHLSSAINPTAYEKNKFTALVARQGTLVGENRDKDAIINDLTEKLMDQSEVNKSLVFEIKKLSESQANQKSNQGDNSSRMESADPYKDADKNKKDKKQKKAANRKSIIRTSTPATAFDPDAV